MQRREHAAEREYRAGLVGDRYDAGAQRLARRGIGFCDAAQRLRPDVVSETDQRESFQAIAPQVEAGLYLVPQVIE